MPKEKKSRKQRINDDFIKELARKVKKKKDELQNQEEQLMDRYQLFI